tara:strand:- start:5205 stop:5840 length:636 start_codon:yes stop_codon:yes gene_type:complete
MLRKVKVYGHLAEHLGQSTFEALARTPAEAMRFLLCNFPELRGLMRDGYYKVAVGRNDLQLVDHPEQLGYPAGQTDEIRIIPVVSGAGGGGGKILLGAALIGLAVATGGTSLAFGAAGFGAAVGVTAGTALGLSIAAGNIGLALVLGGTAQLLSPTPQVPDFDGDPRNNADNFSFSGVQNVSREGVPVPVAYGEVITGSVVISAGLNVEEI